MLRGRYSGQGLYCVCETVYIQALLFCTLLLETKTVAGRPASLARAGFPISGLRHVDKYAVPLVVECHNGEMLLVRAVNLDGCD